MKIEEQIDTRVGYEIFNCIRSQRLHDKKVILERKKIYKRLLYETKNQLR